MTPIALFFAVVAVSGAVGFYLGYRFGRMEEKATCPREPLNLKPAGAPPFWPSTFCAMGCGSLTDGVQDFCARCISEYHLDDPYR